MTSTTLAGISRNVSDLRRSVAFYLERLGFRTSGPVLTMDTALVDLLGYAGRTPKTQRLKFGEEELELVEAGANARPYPADSTSADLWFQHFAIRCVDIDVAYRRLYRKDSTSPAPIAISRCAGGATGPVSLPSRSGGAIAFKFRDPDGHPVQLLQLPRPTRDRHVLPEGIDHSAISVADAQRSIAFYTTVLGMTVVNQQRNDGSEQCMLDDLEDDEVDVVAWQPSGKAAPHIDLLAYRSPVGRSLKTPSMAHDIASDRLVLEVADIDALVNSLASSPRIVCNRASVPVALLPDLDGHLLLLVGRAGHQPCVTMPKQHANVRHRTDAGRK